MKKVLGYLLMTISLFSLVLLFFIVQSDIPREAFINIPNLFKNDLSSSEHYRIIGVLTGFLTQVTFTILFFFLGKKLIKT